MNVTPMSSAGGASGAPHLVTSAPKFQQQINGAGFGQQVVGVVGEGGGVQYVRTLDGGAALQANTPHFITLPITLPGAKPGDPQQTMQIQVMAPNMQSLQTPKYMQIPLQGFQQGVGAVLTLSYSPESGEGLQLVNNVPEGMQLLVQPSDIQLMQQQQPDKDQAILIPNHQPTLVEQISSRQQLKTFNNNNVSVKQENDPLDVDDESSELGGESTNSDGSTNWSAMQPIVQYDDKRVQEAHGVLPVSLQQFLRLNPDGCIVKREIEVEVHDEMDGVEARTHVDDPLDAEDPAMKTKKKKKYKKRPLKPPRPKPGQVQIAKALDGSPIFCCPECHMAYPEKEQLEQHLVVHKIERRFICGICGAGLKRKEHLERHKLGHNPERPYVCGVCTKGFKRKEHLNLHAVIHSGEKTEICQECGKGFYRKDHLRKHTRSHVLRRARDDVNEVTIYPRPDEELSPSSGGDNKLDMTAGGGVRHTVMPEITIHVPTSSNMQVPVHISVPHHVISTLPNGQQTVTLNTAAQAAQHTINVEELFAQQS